LLINAHPNLEGRKGESVTNLIVVFLTGLTTGGLSCLAVQGGLLASSVAYQAEQKVQKQQGFGASMLLFLGAKLVAYTILGFLLGWLGSMLQLTPFMRAILQLVIGVFMIGTALRMLDIHPTFRYFALEPPTFLTRYIRRTAKNSRDEIITPLFLGALTVLIPCGVTQAMMALAIGTGDAVQGATIMFAFTLGASPIFFSLAYLTTQLGGKLEARFLTVVALVVFTLGLVSINGGLNLLGRPIMPSPETTSSAPAITQPPLFPLQPGPQSLRNPAQSPAQPFLDPVGPPQPGVEGSGTPGTTVTINALDYGYNPPVSRAQAEQPIQLKLVTNKNYSCSRAFVIPALNISHVLPETGVTTIELPPQPAGSVLYFTCSMGMFRGQIQF
jgi:uncharacterized protein